MMSKQFNYFFITRHINVSNAVLISNDKRIVKININQHKYSYSEYFSL